MGVRLGLVTAMSLALRNFLFGSGMASKFAPSTTTLCRCGGEAKIGARFERAPRLEINAVFWRQRYSNRRNPPPR